MKQQVLNLKVSGLYTNPNQFSEIPQGALSVAENVVIDKGSVIESRRGFDKYGDALSNIDSLHDFQDKLIVQYSTSLAYDSGSGVWTNYSGSYEPPSGFKMRSVKQNSNFYFTTDAGIKKLSNVTGTVASAGVPKCLDGEVSVSGTSGGWLQNNHTVAYRMVLGIQDTNNNLILGAPSGRAIVNNSLSGTRSTTVKFYIPSGLTTSYFYQVYRSPSTSSASIVPNDELQLIYENNISSTDITNGYIQFNDIRPDSLKGAFLYTNAGQEGILQANDQPPLACDICNYKQMVFFANTTTKQRKIFTLIGTTATTGTVGSLASGDTLTIGGVTYTGTSGSENVSTNTFKVFTAGTPSENIENTCFSLLRVVNQSTSNSSYYGYYISGYNDLPGQMLIEERGIGGNAIVFTSSNGTAFNPVIPSSGTTYTSDNEETQNRVYYSKQGQPEAVPIVNYFNIGSKDFPIQRIIPLRDSIFIFKEDGVFRILGEDPTSLRTQIFDNTATIIGANTAVELANTIYLYSDQGVVSCSDNGLSIMSLPIEDQLFKLEVLTGFTSTAHAVSYESDRKYIFFTKTLAGDATATQAWVYNQVTNAWTKWLLTATCAYVFDGKMYFGGANGYVYQERKSYSIADYKDEDYDVTITGVTGTNVELSSVLNVNVGNILYQSGLDSYISAVTGTTGSGVVAVEDVGFTTGSAVVYSSIPCLVEWAQESAQNPGILKHFREVTLLMRNSEFKTLEIGFTSSLDDNPEYIEIEPQLEGQWGSFAWGSQPWGGGLISRPVPIRTYVPLTKSRASWLFLRVRSDKSESNFAIAGASIIFTPMSERFNG
jgi:hypothetical protein